MKYYVFFANTIKRVGGAQLYIKSKAHFLTQNGWVVSVVYHQDGDLIITELKNYCSHRCPYLYKPSYMYMDFKRNKVVKEIIQHIGINEGKIVFESHSRTLASWAEIVAESIGKVTHICFDLDECITIPKPMFEFYKFKYNRHELYGILPVSIDLFFKGTGFKLNYGSPYLQANGGADCIADCNTDIKIIEFSGYTIGVVGRLEKAYVWEYAKMARLFIEKHSDQQFTLVFVGGAPPKENPEEQILQLFKNNNNVKLIFTGYLYPIPRVIINSFKICLSGAGAAWAICREGVATITIDPRDFLANGILGLTTKNSVFSENEKKPVLWWMEEIYNHPDKYTLPRVRYDYDFFTHINAIKSCSNIFVYNTSFISYRLPFIEHIKRFINSTLPITQRESLAAYIRKLKFKL